MKKSLQTLILASALLSGTFLSAQAPTPGDILGVSLVPPAPKSQLQMNRDEANCYSQAKQETGVDPLAPPPRPDAPQDQRGPLATAAPIAVGVAMHSPIGLGVSAARRRRDANENNQQQTSYDEAWQQSLSKVRQAFGACMSGMGYTIN